MKNPKNVLFVIPAQAGIQSLRNAFCLNPLDSRLPPAFARVAGDGAVTGAQ